MCFGIKQITIKTLNNGVSYSVQMHKKYMFISKQLFSKICGNYSTELSCHALCWLEITLLCILNVKLVLKHEQKQLQKYQYLALCGTKG